MVEIGLGSGYLVLRYTPLMFPFFVLAKLLGIKHFDTAQFYGDGAGETAIGRFVKGDGAVVVTKIGLSSLPGGGVGNSERWNTFFGPTNIPPLVKGSLERLRRKKIDTLLLHCPEMGIDFSPHIEALEKLRQSGLIGRIGFSADSESNLVGESGWASIVEVNVLLLEKLHIEQFECVFVNGVFRESGGLHLFETVARKHPTQSFVVLLGSTKPWRIISSWNRLSKLGCQIKKDARRG